MGSRCQVAGERGERLDISENEPETLMQQDADINCRRCLLKCSLLIPFPSRMHLGCLMFHCEIRGFFVGNIC
jgi:hypothetical protein